MTFYNRFLFRLLGGLSLFCLSAIGDPRSGFQSARSIDPIENQEASIQRPVTSIEDRSSTSSSSSTSVISATTTNFGFLPPEQFPIDNMITQLRFADLDGD